MVNGQSKIKTYLNLFIPSGFGVVIYTFLAALLVFLHQFSAIERYLDLPTHFQFSPIFLHWLDTGLTRLIGEARTQTLVVGLFWAGVGLGVYVFLHGVSRFLNDLGEGIDQRKYFWPKGTNRNRPLFEALERFFFRFVALVALLYVVFGPLAHVLGGPILKDVVGSSLAIQLSVWFVAIWLMLHVCVILVRLVILKPRIFE
jgi:hypothetical protein